MMATLPTLLQPKTLPIKADPVGPPQPTEVDRATQRVSDIERQLGLARGQQAEFQAEQGMMKAGQEAKRAEGMAAATRAEREAIETSEPFRKTEDVEREMMGAYFQPTQRSAQENAALFSLINVLGLFIGRGGKQSATQALSAMNGMLEGKQAGDSQRFKEEKIKFDTNLKALNNKYTVLTSQLKKVADLAARDKQAAAQELDVVLAREQADFLKTHINKVGLAKTIQELEGALKGSQRALDIANQNEIKAAEARRRAEEAMERERFRRETQMMLRQTPQARLPGQEKPPKTISEAQLVKLEGMDSVANGLEELMKDFKPEYAGLGVLGIGADFELEAKRRLGEKAGTDAARWWGKYERLQAPNRHALFGATLTGNELKNYQSFTAKKSDAPETVKAYLQDQIDYSRNVADERRDTFERAGYKVPEGKAKDFVKTYSGDQRAKEDLSAQATQAFGAYEPDKYEYRINPDTGAVQRKKKE